MAGLMETADKIPGSAELSVDLPLAKRKFLQSPVQGDRYASCTTAVGRRFQLRCENGRGL
jgi:hypothetical protein